MGEDPTASAPSEEPLDCRDLLLLARELLRACGAAPLGERIKIVWNTRLRSTAGRAFPKLWRIELNPRVRAFAGETDRTFRHELAHLLVAWNHEHQPGFRRRRRQREPHGPEWKRACAALGIGGESRCHTLSLSAPRKLARPHAYECPACLLVVRRVRPIARGRMLACGICCRQQARGRFDRRFQLRKIDPATPTLGFCLQP